MYRIITVILITAILSGCETVSSSSRFYTSKTAMILPSKDEKEIIPVLNPAELVNRKYMVIGNLSFSAGYGWDYMDESIQYNGRKNGADGFLVRNFDEKTQQYTYYVPGYTTYNNVTTYHSGTMNTSSSYYGTGSLSGYNLYGSGHGSYGGISTTSVPQYHPGYSGVGFVNRQEVNVDYIIFLDKETWGMFGFVMGNIENGGVIVEKVLKGFPADTAGMKSGDILLKIGDMNLKSVEQYFKDNTGFQIGKQYEILVSRDGKEYRLLAEPISFNAYMQLVEQLSNKK